MTNISRTIVGLRIQLLHLPELRVPSGNRRFCKGNCPTLNLLVVVILQRVCSIRQRNWRGRLKGVARVGDLADDRVTRRRIWCGLLLWLPAAAADLFRAELWAYSCKRACRRFLIGSKGVWGVLFDVERERLLKVELLGRGPEGVLSLCAPERRTEELAVGLTVSGGKWGKEE